MEINREIISEKFIEIQNKICKALDEEDGLGKFTIENWKREEGGGGITRILQHGNVIEKGGVNFSAVHGILPENIQSALNVSDSNFFATGVSIVIHPESPMVPIIHMNIRYFELANGAFWFGGGIDLTPHYIDEEDAKWFHLQLKNSCDKFDKTYYPKFKQQADDYFFIPHRNETRGIGGIFFDRLNEGYSKNELLEFVLSIGNLFAPIYTRFMNKNCNLPYNSDHKKWQAIRRGRYVEFNLVYDKGTKFGLYTNGRIESILMSLPENAGWFYNFVPKADSEEEKTLNLLKKGINWV
ncbi:oxygen-dependent coproporphyrinogen oxidase [soil metagenome]